MDEKGFSSSVFTSKLSGRDILAKQSLLVLGVCGQTVLLSDIEVARVHNFNSFLLVLTSLKLQTTACSGLNSV